MTPEEIAALQTKLKDFETKNSELNSQIEKLSKPKDEPKPAPKDDSDLNTKVALENKEKEEKQAEAKNLEAALTFNLTSKSFIEENQSILPKDMVDIFTAADKEKYDSAVDKANATKSALIKSFFDVQENLDLLTKTQKTNIEDYFKLTVKARQARANDIFENIFEPALATVKNIKKAEEVAKAKAGVFDPSEVDAAYKDKIMKGSKSHYLGEKHGS